MPGHLQRLLGGAVGAALVLGGFAACGSDSPTASTGNAASSASSSASSSGGANADVCNAYIGVSIAFTEFQSNAGGDTPPDAATVKSFIAGQQADIDKVRANEPAAVKDSLDTVLAAVDAAGESGDISALDNQAFGESVTKTDEYFAASCDVNKLDVTAVDYGYQGIPDTVDAGTTAVHLTNATKAGEAHEMVVVRKKAGVTESFDDLLQLPEDQVGAKVDMVGSAFAPAGESGYTFLKLTPGDYLAVCFIPQGTTGPDAAGSGPPHFMLGMKQQFKVS